MERKLVPTRRELKRMMKEASEQPIECKMCGGWIDLLYWEKRKRKFFTDCQQHQILEEAMFTNN